MTFMWIHITNTKQGSNFSKLPLISKKFYPSYWQTKSDMNIINIFVLHELIIQERSTCRSVLDLRFSQQEMYRPAFRELLASPIFCDAYSFT
jgi:hypothetical protein